MSKMYFGVHPKLEAEANELLRLSLQGVTSHSAKSDVLTPWKAMERRSREVYVPSGTPDPAARRGMYHRVLNQRRPHLNSRDGCLPARAEGSLTAFVQEHGRSPDPDG